MKLNLNETNDGKEFVDKNLKKLWETKKNCKVQSEHLNYATFAGRFERTVKNLLNKKVFF